MSDALKRRYQVFVSSTFHDLIEERQHVMRALLQTKCIPVGMELFPAASLEQLRMIERIIDDCDYYIVIIAGKYGTVPLDSERSFTEHEFDYAISRNKPVLAFCHKNVSELKGSQLESTDLNRERLDRFRTKIMTNRVCNFWTSPVDLESKVKTAIINALEYDPQPGWVRASLPTQETPLTSNQSIETETAILTGISEIKRHLGQTRRTVSIDGASTLCVKGDGLDGKVATSISDRFVQIGITNFAATFIGPGHVHYTFPIKTEFREEFLNKLASEFSVHINLTPGHKSTPNTSGLDS